MSNKVKILMGYAVNDYCVTFGEADFIAEVQTDGEDHNGYRGQETLGVCKNEFDDICIFRGSTDREKYEECTAIIMSQEGVKLSRTLFKLAEKLKKLGE